MKQETLDAMRAWLDGETVEVQWPSGSWFRLYSASEAISAIFDDASSYRIKPRTIRIGEYDVPEPCRVKPKDGTDYFVPDLDFPEAPDEYIWNGDDWDSDRFERGLVHLTSGAAELHAKALVSPTEMKP